VRWIASLACVAAALSLAAADHARADVYNCQVRQSWSVANSGDLELYDSKIYVGDRFTVDDKTGEVKGAEDTVIWRGPWKLVQEGGPSWSLIVFSFYLDDAKPQQILTVMTWINSPEKSFSHYHPGSGTVLTGLCRLQ